MRDPFTYKIKVNGKEWTVSESTGSLSYDRVVRLSNLSYRRDYLVYLEDTTEGAKPTRVFHDHINLVLMDGLAFTVVPQHWWGLHKPKWLTRLTG